MQRFTIIPILFLAAVMLAVVVILFVAWLVRAARRQRQTEFGARAQAPDQFPRAEMAAARLVSPEVARPFAPPVELSPEHAVLRPPARDTKFTYTTGDRPLEGYTIKRGIGRGGFGEVYYGVSDGGKEVALKLVQRHLDVELRGVGQCLNLKHPHLVTLYDVKQAANGDHWVVMEHVSGVSLADVLAANPNGLPVDQAAAWLTSISAGVGHLHEQGIVHRDLKPGNIFVENGIVKIGDYGLAKFISASRRSGQTESVGTVHYMAPEVSRGRYGKEIDLYALGVILYEMLTGRVPFDGESPGEILMKHLTAEPDTSVLPEPYRALVARLLAKEPRDRYESVQAMLAEVTGGASPATASPQSEIVVPKAAMRRTMSWHPSSAPAAASRAGRRPHPLMLALAIGLSLTTLYVAVASFLFITTRWRQTTPNALLAAVFTGVGGSAPLAILTSFVWIRCFSGRVLERYLVRAAWQGDWPRVQELVARGAEVNAPSWGGLTPLLAVARHGHDSIARLLLSHGADVNVRGRGGKTALGQAARYGHAQLVQTLLDAGADVNARERDGTTPLIHAAGAGHAAILRMLLDHGADTEARGGSDGSTPLIWAAYYGHTACVEALLEKGADVHAKDTDSSSTALIWAAYCNHPNVVRVLLEHGADPNETDSGGETAMDHTDSDKVRALLEAAMAQT